MHAGWYRQSWKQNNHFNINKSMKTNRLISIVVIFVIAGCFSTELVAQEAIKALVKRCETMNNVDVNIVRRKNKDSKELNRSIINISFNNNEALVQEIVAAFNKDRNAADEEMENRSNGKVNNLTLRFGQTRYSFTQSNNGDASISVIEQEEFRWRGRDK